MNNIDYLKLILKHDTMYYKNWVFSAFSVSDYDSINELDEDDQYIGQIVIDPKVPDKLFFINEEKTLTMLTDYKKGSPLMSFKDRIILVKGDLPNVSQTIETNLGNLFFNKFVICYAFNDKIPFLLGRINLGDLENKISKVLKDTPPPDTVRSKDVIYVDELVKFCEATLELDSFNYLIVPTGSERTMVANPVVLKRRDELLAEYKDQLHDPAIIAKILDELVKLDKASFEGKPESGYYISGKQYDVIRAKKFVMYGMEAGMDANNPTLITKSLDEGWDMDDYPAMIDGFRNGSYSRGKETANGGTEVNWLQRVLQNRHVVEDDCGATNGLPWLITESNKGDFDGLYYIKDGKVMLASNEAMAKMVGQVLQFRSPMLCKTKGLNYCGVCVGSVLASRPNALHTTGSNVGSVFMLAAMKSMHGKALKTKRFNFTNAIS